MKDESHTLHIAYWNALLWGVKCIWSDIKWDVIQKEVNAIAATR